VKALTRIKLINWHYFVNQTIKISGSTLITGDNGSGKSTILDALQLVLVADLRRIKFNISAFDETRRNLLGYLRCKTGSDAEDGRVYLRSGDITSYVALEFYDDVKKKHFILGVAVDSYADNVTWDSKYFKIEDCRLDDALFLVGNRPYNIKEFKGALRGKKATVYATGEHYRQDLLVKLGSLSERFFSLLVKALSFKPITDIREFVYSYVLEERHINIDVMRENLRRYKEYSDLAAQAREKLGALEKILARHAEIEREKEKVLVQEYLIRRAERERAVGELEENTRLEKKKRAELRRLGEELLRARGRKEELQREYDMHRDALAADRVFRLVERLNGEIRDLGLQLEQLGGERDRVTQAAVAEARVVEDLLAGAGDDLAGPEDRERLEALAGLLREAAEGRMPAGPGAEDEAGGPEAGAGAGEETAARALADGQALLHEIAGRVQRKLWECNGELDKLRTEEGELKRDLASLRDKKFVYDRRVTELRDLITQSFKHRGQDVVPAVLCELLEVPDEKWQDAVEGWLNTQRFDLIVEPGYFNHALEVYERRKRRHNISGVGLVNTARVLHFLDRAEKGSLAGEVRSKNKYARAYVNQLMGNVMKCENEQELKRHRRAITPTCMTYQNNAARQIHFHVYETPYIGERAFARQIARKEKRLAEVLEEVRVLGERAGALEKLLPMCSGRDEKYIFIRERLDVFRRLEDTRGLLNEKRRELAGIDTSGITEIKRKMELLKEQVKEAEEDIEKLKKAEGRLDGDIERVVAARAGLEAAVERTEEDLGSFCAGHPGVVETGEKRYVAERRKKSPGEIAANFLHNRKSLDTLIANRQKDLLDLLIDYNNTYQFGSRVDADDVGDYRAEHEKLAGSELPEYEEKIQQAQQEAEVEFKEHFIFKLQENIENAHTEFGFLNEALKGIAFGTDRYRFLVRPSEEHRKFHDMIMDTNLIEGGVSLFDTMFRERHREAMDELFDRIINLPPQYLPESVAEFTDYRTFLEYDIKIYHDNGETSTFSKVCREKSGGETQTPYYVVIVASFVQLYRAKTNRDGIRLMMFDEAFNRMDGDRVENSLRFIQELGMQAVIAAPTDKCEYIAPHLPTTLLVLRDGHYSWLEDYHQLRG
jgi:energy-coupling factor transporter ATP-binding protein EcfA2